MKKPRRDLPDDPEEFRLTLVEHLEELRSRIMRSIGVLGGAWLVAWFFLPPVYAFLNGVVDAAILPTVPKGVEFKEVFHNATDPFMLQLKLSFMMALAISIPFLVLQIWGFVAPGLKPQERKPFKALAPYSVLLFFTGAGFAWLVLPNALRWFTSYLGNFNDVSLYQEAGTMVFFIIKMLIAFGLGFQLPLVVFALGALDLLSAETLTKYWRHSATVIFVVAMIITPSNDPLTMLMMAIPLVLLFSVSVVLVRFVQKRKKKKAQLAESTGDSE